MMHALSCAHSFHWLVWQIDFSWFIDLPQLQTVKLGFRVFENTHSIVFESECWCWSSYSDLPKLQSIQLNELTLRGDSSPIQKTIQRRWKNTLTMQSESKWTGLLIDLPSLTEMMGLGDNFARIGSVIIESIDLYTHKCRYPQIVIWRNSIGWSLLRIHTLTSIIKYSFPLSMIFRC